MFSNSKTKVRKLRVFLCHSSKDKLIVRDVYKLLLSEKWIDPWLDEEKLRPGQNWKLEIGNAIDNTDVVLVFLSRIPMASDGFVHKEIKTVLDKSEEKPAGTIYIIPVRLDDCDIPKRLSDLQYLDISLTANWYTLLLDALKLKAKGLGLPIKQQDTRVQSKDLELPIEHKDTRIQSKDLVDRYSALLSDYQRLDQGHQKLKRALEIKEIEVRAILSQAYQIANIDVLTFLPNRRKIMVDLQEEIIRSEKHNTPLSVILADLDNFKHINDTYGQTVGDDVIRNFAGEIRDLVRHPITVGRFRGDKFMFILPNSELRAATTFAEELCHHVRTSTIKPQKTVLHLTISAGIVKYKVDEENWTQLLLRLDKALLIAKNNGGDKWAALED